jgi:hypothetical protein
MENQSEVKVLNYISCNWDSLLLVSIIIPILICSIIIVKVISFNEYYHAQDILVPMFFYLGDSRILKKRTEHVIFINRNNVSNASYKENMEGIQPESQKYYSVSEIVGDVIDTVKECIMLPIRLLSNANKTAIQVYDDRREKLITESFNINDKLFTDFFNPAWRKIKL